jgi:hypothetical protein
MKMTKSMASTIVLEIWLTTACGLALVQVTLESRVFDLKAALLVISVAAAAGFIQGGFALFMVSLGGCRLGGWHPCRDVASRSFDV